MGTNYYLRNKTKTEPHCDTCQCEQTRDGGIHIGKSSIGWRFVFNGTHQKSVQSWRMYLTFMVSGAMGWHIEDEYGNPRTTREFWSLVEGKMSGPSQAHLDPGWWTEDGCDFIPGNFS